MKNYRPISILPVVSKIIENVMHTQLTDYFTSQQYGYRANRSTELAALELMDKNLDNMNRNLTPVNVYIDLSKAFDCLDHNAIRLLKNYLSDRDQIQIVYLTQTCIFLRHKKITLIIICLYTYMFWRSSKGYVAASARSICTTWTHKVSTSWDLTWNTSRFGHGPSSI